MSTIKAKASTITVGGIVLSCYMKPDGSFAFSLNQLKSLDVIIGDSTGKKYAEPLILKDNPSREMTEIEGTNESAELISLDCFSTIVQAYAALGNHKCLAFCLAAISESPETRAI